jgi:hypothetical protein
MIYRFKVWCWLPMTTEIHLTALNDEEAVKTFNKIDLTKGFDWRDDGMRKSRVTYELINVQNTDKGISSSGKSGEKS